MADPFIKQLLDFMVFDKNSLVRLIQYSETFSSWFAEEIHRQEQQPVSSKRIKNLRFAKQRFESTQKPIDRSVLFLEALIATAQRILADRGRSSTEGKQAEIFLRYLDPEVLLTLAMCADAGDESLLLTRTADDEDMQPEVWPEQCEEYLQRLLTLFGAEQFCFQSGYTYRMHGGIFADAARFLYWGRNV